MALFKDRRHAGQRLAQELAKRNGRNGTVVLALPRGGVPVGFEVAQTLHAPLDVFIVRKLGYPEHEELAMGAIASGGVQVLDEEIVERLHVSETTLRLVAARQLDELHRREEAYRGDMEAPQISGREAILVDDGLATAATMMAAVAGLKKLGPSRITVACPVAASHICESLEEEVDEVIRLSTPEPFSAVRAGYLDFTPITDDVVRRLLKYANSQIGVERILEPDERQYAACSNA